MHLLNILSNQRLRRNDTNNNKLSKCEKRLKRARFTPKMGYSNFLFYLLYFCTRRSRKQSVFFNRNRIYEETYSDRIYLKKTYSCLLILIISEFVLMLQEIIICTYHVRKRFLENVTISPCYSQINKLIL